MIASADQPSRDRFINDLGVNFSVIAPAGVGKTQAIADRVCRYLIRASRGGPGAEALAVVTYTNKAADEMRARVFERLRALRMGSGGLAHLASKCFIGTIHGFSVDLIRRHGWRRGWPLELGLIEDDEEAWNAFMRGTGDLLGWMTPEQRRLFDRLLTLDDVLELARSAPMDAAPADAVWEPCPELNFAAVFACATKGNGAANVQLGQERVRQWQSQWAEADGALMLPPECPSMAKSAFGRAWAEAFAPLRSWRAGLAACVAQRLAADYAAWRLERGLATFDDVVRLAGALFERAEVAAAIREVGWTVILDEAQDTTPAQFSVLLEATRAPQAGAGWPKEAGSPPGPGRFCQVGDPQQSLYERAELPHYLAVHRALQEPGVGEELTFDVTHRCDVKIITLLNLAFPAVLSNADGGQQVDYVPLRPGPRAASGQVVRLPIAAPGGEGLGNKAERDEAYLPRLAAALAGLAPERLRAADPGAVALLVPRREWAWNLGLALRRQGISVVVESDRGPAGRHPAHAWIVALLTVLADPENSWELVGVLRDMWGLADDELAAHARARGGWHLLQSSSALGSGGAGAVTSALREIAEVLAAVSALPLAEAVTRAFAMVSLKERMAAILEPGMEEAEAIVGEYEVRAVEAERAGLDLAAFAARCRAGLNQRVKRLNDREGEGWRILTCHGAKGLTFDTVIVPFLFRPIPPPPRRTPRWTRKLTGAFAAELPGESPDEAVIERESWARREAAERLLYVTCTRARHTVIFVDDAAFFPKQEDSFGDCLRVGEGQANRSWWDNLSREATAGEARPETPTRLLVGIPASPPDEGALLRTAVERLALDPVRVRPSDLAHGHDDPVEPRRYPETGVPLVSMAAYGNWWHEMMEDAPWGDLTAWRTFGDERLRDCPDAARGEAELARWMATDLCRRLNQPGGSVRTELPLFWQGQARQVLDGYVDLVARLADGSHMVVDWKTDRLSAEEIRERYAPQITAYREALGDLLRTAVTACIYSTAHGLVLQVS